MDGTVTDDFPVGDSLLRAKPMYEYLDGFKADISACRRPEDLPGPALDYIRFIEDAVNCPIKYVSVGAGRAEYLIMD